MRITIKPSDSNCSRSIYFSASSHAFHLCASSSCCVASYYDDVYNLDIQFDRNVSICYDLGQISYTFYRVYPKDITSRFYPSNDTPFSARCVDSNTEEVFWSISSSFYIHIHIHIHFRQKSHGPIDDNMIQRKKRCE